MPRFTKNFHASATDGKTPGQWWDAMNGAARLAPMELLIVRHGKPEAQKVSSGAADPDLAPIGKQQAEAVGVALQDQGVDHIVASPMRRAYQTAEPLARLLQMEIEVVDALKESDYQATQYLPADDNMEEVIRAFQDNPDHIFGADGREVFTNRVIGAFTQVVADNAGRTVAVFCHGMVTAAWIGHILNIDNVFDLSPDYTGISRVRGSARHRKYSLRSFNELQHLNGLPNTRM